MIRKLAFVALIAVNISAAQAADVHFADLDLANPADAAILNSRIAAAAAESCTVKLDFGVSASKILEAEKDQKACIARASAQALAKVRTFAATGRPTASRLARQ